MAPLDARFGLPKNPIRIKPFERHGDGAVIQNHTAQAVRSGTVPELDTSKEYIWIVTKDGILVIGEEVVVGHETDSFAQKLGHPTLVRGEAARIAGELRFVDNVWVMNNKSGRYSVHPDRGQAQLENAVGVLRASGVNVRTEYIQLR